MSRYNPHLENAKLVYEAAERWRDTCLLQDGSVFSDKELWTRKNLNDDFENRFMEFIVPTDDPKYKGPSNIEQWILFLKETNSHPEIYQMIAESLWVMYLPCSRGGITPNTKKEKIEIMWKESGVVLPEHEYLQNQYMQGLGNPGAWFFNNMWFELLIFLLFVREIKMLSTDDRRKLLTKNNGKEISHLWDDWPKKWREQWPEQWEKYSKKPGRRLQAKNRQIRHMLLHLLFPKYFERAFSGSDKRKIIKAFKNQDPSGKPWSEIDGILQTIRADKEKEYGPDIDFYSKPLDRMWGSRKNKEPKGVKEPESPPFLSIMSNIHLNRIFYGPPGTGKTYRTINAALEILDPDFYKENKDQRKKLRERYEKLKEEGQIAFVTFHQSFGYEEFVEGIRPLMGEEVGEQVSYEIKDGVFKRICERAASTKPLRPFEDAIEKLKEECSDNPVIMKTVVVKNENFVWHEEGSESFKIKPVEPKNPDAKPYAISVNRLRKFYEHPKQAGVKLKAILNYLKEKYGLDDTQSISEHKNYALIIDEINRGNISRIFGELITLIEKSKRLGEAEETTATLPYSGESFGVPNNLYIIGTMNTADRSIALLDTALRRRFRFIEMMPDSEKLEGIEIDGVDVPRLLEKMNARIETLYDRDHQIGHSFFMQLRQDRTLDRLNDIFRYEILPLLQEYFYDDWAKIDLVLNKNGFLTKNNPPAELLNTDASDPDKKLWKINEESFTADQYRKIFQDDGD